VGQLTVGSNPTPSAILFLSPAPRLPPANSALQQRRPPEVREQPQNSVHFSDFEFEILNFSGIHLTRAATGSKYPPEKAQNPLPKILGKLVRKGNARPHSNFTMNHPYSSL
jgi:hypothetical protein